MKILIKVTKDILRRSADCNDYTRTTNCAISLAVMEIFPNSITERMYIGVRYSDVYYAYIGLPEEARNFISWFDGSTTEQRIAMPELSFEIDVPAEVIDSIGISQVYKILSESKTLELVHP